MLFTGTVLALASGRPIALHYVPYVRPFHIRVRVDSEPYYGPSQVGAASSGKDILEVEVFRSSYDIGGFDALHCFSGIRAVKKAKVHGSIDRKFAQWLEGCVISNEARHDPFMFMRRSSNFDSLDTTFRWRADNQGRLLHYCLAPQEEERCSFADEDRRTLLLFYGSASSFISSISWSLLLRLVFLRLGTL